MPCCIRRKRIDSPIYSADSPARPIGYDTGPFSSVLWGGVGLSFASHKSEGTCFSAYKISSSDVEFGYKPVTRVSVCRSCRIIGKYTRWRSFVPPAFGVKSKQEGRLCY